MQHFALEDFPEMDSLYRLVNLATKRADQISKPEVRSLISTGQKSAIMVALEEIREGKVGYRIGDGKEDDYEIG